mmetsp:Transcript_694/g.1097  ORF Transcript_694/g.1097 Transcript_694/m.1097 type:complete len:369 (+) Transcript_694:224-1330(+)|eukprot:CAMPEP_0194228478 /NCGR_PEP_ID=MMETSP0156-20130528/43390_1 /TAXON_ID=33649 /ORGANISM="Thalassionema nitzschioides, Strain L26-B" /LENGTH=368 /DNA_ID=CAMNT_0038960993 /DNA_START=206 /DNA_END=1312 /DNA_ORIENTATION=+
MTFLQMTRFVFLLSLSNLSHGFAPKLNEVASFSLSMVKRNQRAFIEKNLEDAMNNDWRVFRARLVAQEKSEADTEHRVAPKNESPTGNVKDQKLKKQGDLGDLFADAISSIFQKKDKGVSSNIFDGDTIGNAISDDINCEDPFVSPAEIPILLESKVNIDKHRWAHTISHIEPGCVLVANEKLGGVFHQTVVLVIDHCESQGSTGIIINRPLKGDLRTTASMQNTTLDLSLKLAFSKSPVTYGGPVNADQFSILHGFGEVDGSRKLAPGIFVGGSEVLIDEVRMNRLDPSDALFVKGHAAWVAGQLTREISKGVWYPASVSSDLVLRYASASTDEQSDLWSEIMHCMGDEFSTIAQANAGRGDHRMMP